MIRKIISRICTAFAKRTLKSFGEGLRVNFPCKFSRKTEVGHHCNFNGIKVYGGGSLLIGNFFHSGKGIEVFTDTHNYDKGDAIPYDATNIKYNIEIGDFVWIGADVKILGNVKIADGAIVQAGSVVVSDIPYCGIAGGHPAKVFKYRDIEHFEKLKEEKKYH